MLSASCLSTFVVEYDPFSFGLKQGAGLIIRDISLQLVLDDKDRSSATFVHKQTIRKACCHYSHEVNVACTHSKTSTSHQH